MPGNTGHEAAATTSPARKAGQSSPVTAQKAIDEAKYIVNAAIIVAQSGRTAIVPLSRIAPSEPMAGVAISAANAMRFGTDETVVTDNQKINTNAQKQRPESTVVFRACPPLAPSARGGSERLAPAKSKTVTTPAQKSAGSEDKGPPAPNSRDAIMSKKIATKAPEQTAREPRPAPAASATWSQPLCTRFLPKEFDYVERT
jgi:hypothetical protein